MEMGRTATDFGGHLILPIQSATQFPQVADIPGHILFQMPFIECNNRFDVVSFLLGKDYEDHGTTC